MEISIVGCGWLGLPLGESLANRGHKVIGSTTQDKKLALLESKGIAPVLMKLEPMPIGKKFNQLFQTELLIINIPPKRKLNTPEFYEEQIKYLKYQLQQSTAKKVVFISSTSYYPNTNTLVTTNTASDISNGSSKAVVKGEEQISQIEQDLIILRCGGLMGGDRIPGKWFAGKPTKGADTLVNYIHRNDIISTILKLVTEWPSGKSKSVYNLVSPEHPTRKEVHMAMSKKYNFQPPIWEEASIIPSKVVESDFKKAGFKSPLDF